MKKVFISFSLSLVIVFLLQSVALAGGVGRFIGTIFEAIGNIIVNLIAKFHPSILIAIIVSIMVYVIFKSIAEFFKNK